MLTKNWKCLAVLCALTLSLSAVQAEAALVTLTDPGFDGWDEVTFGPNQSGGTVGTPMTFPGWSMVKNNATSAFAGMEINSGVGPSDAPITNSGASLTSTQTGISLLSALTLTDTFAIGFDHRRAEGTGTTEYKVTLTPNIGSPIILFDNTGAGFTNTVFATESGSQVLVNPDNLGATTATLDLFQQTPVNGKNVLDNITLDQVAGAAAVPEPSTLALAGMGLLGLLACGRRRNRRRT